MIKLRRLLTDGVFLEKVHFLLDKADCYIGIVG